MWPIYTRDLSRMLHSNVICTIIVLFLLMMGAMFFIDFFDTVQALNLRQFFSQAPLLLSIFCPALTMGTLAAERSHQTLDLLQTMPVHTWQIILAKFGACITLLAIILLFTLSYPITLATLGPLDWGPVIGGYMALLLLGGGYIALGILASACSKDQISSMLIAFFMCFALTFVHQLSLDASGITATILQNISANVHFSNIARGVVDIRDILYAITLQFFALTATVLVIESRKYPNKIIHQK
ncbi:MAG: ABC transporter permease subunit [Proteobacteria bacterium]|nr:ABC transporter permease subunit [Pseudomonadota bacterium]